MKKCFLILIFFLPQVLMADLAEDMENTKYSNLSRSLVYFQKEARKLSSKFHKKTLASNHQKMSRRKIPKTAYEKKNLKLYRDFKLSINDLYIYIEEQLSDYLLNKSQMSIEEKVIENYYQKVKSKFENIISFISLNKYKYEFTNVFFISAANVKFALENLKKELSPLLTNIELNDIDIKFDEVRVETLKFSSANNACHTLGQVGQIILRKAIWAGGKTTDDFGEATIQYIKALEFMKGANTRLNYRHAELITGLEYAENIKTFSYYPWFFDLLDPPGVDSEQIVEYLNQRPDGLTKTFLLETIVTLPKSVTKKWYLDKLLLRQNSEDMKPIYKFIEKLKEKVAEPTFKTIDENYGRYGSYRIKYGIFNVKAFTISGQRERKEDALQRAGDYESYLKLGTCADFVNWIFYDVITSRWNFIPFVKNAVQLVYLPEGIQTPDNLADSPMTEKICEVVNSELTYPKRLEVKPWLNRLVEEIKSSNKKINEHAQYVLKYLQDENIIDEDGKVLVDIVNIDAKSENFSSRSWD